MEIKEENIEKESGNALSFLEQPAGYHANEEYVADVIKIFHLLERSEIKPKHLPVCNIWINAWNKVPQKLHLKKNSKNIIYPL